MITNSISFPLFSEKSYKLGWFYLNSFAISLTHQLGKSRNGKINVYSGKYINGYCIEQNGSFSTTYGNDSSCTSNNGAWTQLVDEDFAFQLQSSRYYDGLDQENIIPENIGLSKAIVIPM